MARAYILVTVGAILLIAIFSIVSLSILFGRTGTQTGVSYSYSTRASSTNKQTTTSSKSSRIAIISSFVGGSQSGRKYPSQGELDLLLNKACYSKLWGYDFIFNTTYGFDKQRDEIDGKAWWLEYGTWQRVPHIRDRLRDYDWILYADVDYIINEMSRPIESFFKEWELYNKHPSILIPKDFNDDYKAFSAFAVLVKNDPFGQAVIENWMKAGRGLCPKGNFAAEKRGYTWEDSDQPGLWYALVQTYRDFFPKNDTSDFGKKPLCDNVTGIVNTGRAFGPEINHNLGPIILGSGGSDLKKVPSDQPILYSLPNDPSNGGLGWQLKWGDNPMNHLHRQFAFHLDNVQDWNPHAKETLEICKTTYGCYVNLTMNGTLQIGCGDTTFVVQ